MSVKNKLQEIFQKKGLDLPDYKCKRYGGNDHEPKWISTVVLHDGSSYTGLPCQTKTLAEISAANKALDGQEKSNILLESTVNLSESLINLSSTKISESKIMNNLLFDKTPDNSIDGLINKNIKTTILFDKTPDNSIDGLINNNIKTAILVDVENLPNFIKDIPSQKLTSYTVYAFIGEHHCLSDREYPNGVIKIVSPSTRSDGTDTCMQVYTGMLLSNGVYDNYLIATRDHYGSSLVEMISSNNLGWNPKTARLVTKPSQL